MTLEEKLIKYRIEVVPVLGITGRVDFWAARYRTVQGGNPQNIRGAGGKKGEAKTPGEAVNKLLKDFPPKGVK